MKPISGETVLSIIHGPATTGHIKEMSMFLRRPIDVCAKDRLMLFGRCHHRQPRLNLAFDPPPPAGPKNQAGHFTLLDGSEPRNPDARSHPLNCAFDVVSDQTGYPASALRQVAVQRMLVKLYQSRLRGHDYHAQCPACGISGGRAWSTDQVRQLIKLSPSFQGHSHVHVERLKCQRQCECAYPWQYWMNNDISKVKCMGRYLEIFPMTDFRRDERTLFQSDEDLEDILHVLLNSEDGEKVYECLFWEVRQSCTPPIEHHQMLQEEIVQYVQPLKKIGLIYAYNSFGRFCKIGHFCIMKVKAIFKIYEIISQLYGFSTRVFYLETMYPLKPGTVIYHHPALWDYP